MWNGFDDGYFKNNKCYCVSKFEYEDMVSKKTQGTFKSKEVESADGEL